ncbi:ATP-binding protein [Mesosutterella sp. OilRF-GAM-744-9]|uniref:histidine kinase n=1 Tax=Mesosutterella porci TaxID=2915351 RepID=A0ABS9MR40_9BURK|nr:ATP-binding protein [Mesosutterella sp. oilRF-744-WT-GAM-9]MCG5030847.1 ATP-binding protein [Mesosutterella sp. oilRF-744-WT-GAM-9]
MSKDREELTYRGSSMFWRTFTMLMLLITLSVLGGLQTYWTFNELPVAKGVEMQIVSMTNLTRFALVSADPLYRTDLLTSLASLEIRILPKEPGDRVEPLKQNATVELIESMVKEDLGDDTVLAGRVNGEPGLWVSLSIDGDEYWLMTRQNIFDKPSGSNWLWWALIAFLLSTIGATMLTRHIVEPLANLTRAAQALGHGKVPDKLPDAGPKEIREVNRAFNTMVLDLARMEEDRELLLAGVSHDLRTPITRLRLEVELASLPEDSRNAMVQDLEQMENIVNQFLAYARRSNTPLELTNLGETVASAIATSRMDEDPKVSLDCVIRKDVFIMAHPVEIGRIVQNLLVNASRYGRCEDGRLEVFVNVGIQNGQALLSICDHGRGLPESEMERVLRPFERGEKARTGSTGSGLGLAIVDRIAKRSGGAVKLSKNNPSGLAVEIRFPVAEPPKKTRRKDDKKKESQEPAAGGKDKP